MSKHDHEGRAGLAQPFRALDDERRADPLALPRGPHRHRGQPVPVDWSTGRVELDRREQDVPDDAAISLGHERQAIGARRAQRIDDAGFER